MKELSEPILDKDNEDNKKPGWLTPIKIIISLFLVLIILSIYIPISSIKLDPEPSKIPPLNIIPANITILNPALEAPSKNDFLKLIAPNDPVIKQIADRIATFGCSESALCQAKAEFYFVRDNFDYVSDPTVYEYVKSARESLASKGGDCDDGAILLVNLLEAIGIHTRFVFIPGHVYIQAYFPDAPSRYKTEGWINLDATCKYCKFGEIPYENTKSQKTYIEH